MTWNDDYDTDGTPDDCDEDDDNDGAADDVDSDDNNEFACSDDDLDTCDDCSSGSYDIANDGDDFDADGTCDAGDTTPGGEATLSFSNATETSIDLDYSSDVDLVGYQFVVTGVDVTAFIDGGISISTNGNSVLGIDFAGEGLPMGAGNVGTIHFKGDIRKGDI